MSSRTWNDAQLIEAVKTSFTYMDVARKLGLSNYGANSTTIKKHIKRLGLDTSHFWSRNEQLKHARSNNKGLSIEEIFTVGVLDRRVVKSAIIKNNMLPYECAICKLVEWNKQKLSLELDHINGDNADNRLDNLRFLCPNCHSLTDNYCGKKLRNVLRANHRCVDCNTEIHAKATRCRSCAAKRTNKPKIDWPAIEELHQLVLQLGYVGAAKQLGISGNAIKKRLRKNGIVLVFKHFRSKRD